MYNTVNFRSLSKMLRCKLGMLFYTAEPIFGIVFELVQNLLTICYKRLSTGDADYLFSVVEASCQMLSLMP